LVGDSTMMRSLDMEVFAPEKMLVFNYGLRITKNQSHNYQIDVPVWILNPESSIEFKFASKPECNHFCQGIIRKIPDSEFRITDKKL
jgi:hypothetical protein